MKATPLFSRRTTIRENAFIETVLWRVPRPVPGSRHDYKYRLALIVQNKCVLRYDNEAGKGDPNIWETRSVPTCLPTLIGSCMILARM